MDFPRSIGGVVLLVFGLIVVLAVQPILSAARQGVLNQTGGYCVGLFFHSETGVEFIGQFLVCGITVAAILAIPGAIWVFSTVYGAQ